MKTPFPHLLVAALAACSSTDTTSNDSLVTDFGDAVAITDIDEVGDVDTLLLAADDDRVLGHAHWYADTGALEMNVDARAIEVRGFMTLASDDLVSVGELLYSIYELDTQESPPSSCVGNALATCCASGDGWSCAANEG